MGNVLALWAKTAKRPSSENRKVARTRDYLTPDEAEKLMLAAAHAGRYGHGDSSLMLLPYRHSLRVSEFVALRCEQLDFKGGLLHVNRNKNAIPSVQRRRRPQLRALRGVKREEVSGTHSS